MNFKFPLFSAIALESVVANASADGTALLAQLLLWNPSKRPTTTAALRMPFFQRHVQSHAQQPNSRRLSSHKATHKSPIPAAHSDYHLSRAEGTESAVLKASLTLVELGREAGDATNASSEAEPLATGTLPTRSSTDSSLQTRSGVSRQEQARPLPLPRLTASQTKSSSRSARE